MSAFSIIGDPELEKALGDFNDELYVWIMDDLDRAQGFLPLFIRWQGVIKLMVRRETEAHQCPKQ